MFPAWWSLICVSRLLVLIIVHFFHYCLLSRTWIVSFFVFPLAENQLHFKAVKAIGQSTEEVWLHCMRRVGKDLKSDWICHQNYIASTDNWFFFFLRELPFLCQPYYKVGTVLGLQSILSGSFHGPCTTVLHTGSCLGLWNSGNLVAFPFKEEKHRILAHVFI